MSLPFLKQTGELANVPHNERLEHYYKSGRMLVKLAEALGRISLAGRELARLSGYTERVTQLMTVLDDLEKGHYQRTMLSNNNNNANAKPNDDNFDQVVHENISSNPALKPNSGRIVYADNIIK